MIFVLMKKSLSFLLVPVGVGRLVVPFAWLGSAGDLLSWKIDLLQLFHLFVLALLIENVVVVEVTIALVAVHP
jgi:hypothetical protein